MSADLIIQNGKIGDIEGDWNVTEDATPVSPADSAGSVGEVRVSAEYVDGSEFVAGKQSTFVHAELGSIPGYVDTLTVNGPMGYDTVSTVGITSTTPLQKLNAERTVRALAPGDIRSEKTPSYLTWRSNALNAAGDLFFDWNGNVRNYPSMTLVTQIPGISGRPVQVAYDGSIFYLDGINSGGTGTIYKYDSNYNFVTSIPSMAGSSGLSVGGNTVAVRYSSGLINLVMTFDLDLTPLGVFGPTMGGLDAISVVPADGSVIMMSGYDANPISQSLPPGGVEWERQSRTGTQLAGPFQMHLGHTPGTITAFSDNSGLTWWAHNASITGDLQVLLGAVESTTLTTIKEPEYVGDAYSSQFSLWGSTDRNGVILSTNDGVADSGINLDQYFSSHSPYLSEYMRYLGKLCDVTLTYEATDDPTLTPIPWVANVWGKMKEICAAYDVEITTSLVIRDAGSTTLGIAPTDTVAGSISFSMSSMGASRAIEIDYYNPEFSGGMFYNSADYGSVLSVWPRRSVTEIVPVAGYLIDSPISVSYQVSDNDGVTVTPGGWGANGGAVSVSRVPNSDTNVEVTLIGPIRTIPGHPAPYSLSVFVQDIEIPALQIMGYGVRVNPVTQKIYSGAIEASVTEEVGFRVTNTYIDTKERAFDRGIWVTTDAAGPAFNLQGSIPTWEVQSFGETPGAIMHYRDSKYRIVDLGVSYATTSMSAKRHVKVSDFDALWAGQTVGDFDASWGPYTVSDFKIRPLVVW